MNESCQWQGSAKGVLQDAEQDAVGKILRKMLRKKPAARGYRLKSGTVEQGSPYMMRLATGCSF
jgi:RNA:NAD 2'-phosphotransferase (TPT1/KptA family)